MKKLLSLSLAFTFFMATSFATEDRGAADKKVADAFTRHFAAAQSITWNKASDITTATFVLDGQYLAAHFSPDAKMLGVSRNIVSTELPLNLGHDLKSYVAKYWITDVFEYATPDSDAYYVTLENADYKLILKSDAGSFVIYKKTSKVD